VTLIGTSASSKPLYAALGLPESATEDEIRAAFFNISKAHHPDLHNGVENEIFTAAKRAFDILTDPATRTIYDACGIDPNESGGAFRARALDAIKVTAFRIIAEGGENLDILARIRMVLQNDIKTNEAEVRKVERALEKAEKAAANVEKRWKGAEGAKTVILAMVAEQIGKDRANLAPIQRNIETAKMALAMIEEATWEGAAVPVMKFGSSIVTFESLFTPQFR
jgi:curved DNA-binding protein CbpA